MSINLELLGSKKSTLLKEKFILYFSIVGILSLLFFGGYSISQQKYVYGGFELLLASAGIINMLLFIKFKSIEVASAVLITILSVILSMLLITGGISRTGLFWMPTFPALAFFLFQKKVGLVLNFLFIGLVVVLSTIGLFGLIPIAFSFPEIRQFLASYIAISAIIFFYEMVSENAWDKLQTQTKKLSTVNEKLDREASLREEIQNQTQENIQELEETKQAMLNIMEDLQEQQQSLTESKAKDEAMLSSIGDGVVATDNQGVILFTNPSFERLLGWKQSEVVGKRLTDVISLVMEDGTKISSQNRIITRALESHSSQNSSREKVFYLTKSGEQLPVSINVSPIVVGGETIGAIEVFRDITKENEVDKAKTEFVSLASHQLKTPLSAINWYSELLMSDDAGKLNKQQQEYLEEIESGSKRMVELVNALLNVSRLELGTFSIEPSEINIETILKSVLSELKPSIDTKELKIVEKYEKLPSISADPNLSRIIVQNLISNAVKYTPEKGSITISLVTKEAGEEYGGKKLGEACVLFTVADTGYGIPKKQQDKIFTKLFRADNVQEKDTDGTGLGLYIIKSILDSFGGQIWFESEEDKGTTFYVAVPLSGMKAKEGSRTLELSNTRNG